MGKRNKGVVYTEDSRHSNSFDVMWSATGGSSTVFVGDGNSADFTIPSGKVAMLKAVMWLDSPFLFVAEDHHVGLLLYVNRQSKMSYRRQVPAGGALSVTQMAAGFLQGVFLPTFLRLDDSEILSLQLVPAVGVTLTSPRFKVIMTLAENSGDPLNEEFTN